jgi:hypothetical protein
MLAIAHLAMAGETFTAVPLPECDARFRNTNGWTGADGIASVALDDGRTLWLFGDTWVGEIRDGRHQHAKMVNNTVAVQHGRDLVKDRLDFFWGKTTNDQPAAIFIPTDGRGFFWPGNGIQANGRLFIFALQIEKTKGNGAFDFRRVANWLLEVTNPAAPPPEWKTVQHKIPFGHTPGDEAKESAGRATPPCPPELGRRGMAESQAVAAAYGRRRRPQVAATEDGGTPRPTPNASERQVAFGSAALQHEGWVYIFGCDEDRQRGTFPRKHAIVARAPETALDDFARWQFWDGRAWQADFAKTARIFDRAADEYSVGWQPALRKFIAICTPNGMSEAIHLRHANAPSGPWSAPITVYHCPKVGEHKGIFYYAAKGHPELSATNELLITYATNIGDFWYAAAHADIYWPNCVRVRFKEE